MTHTTTHQEIAQFNVHQEVTISAPIATVFASVLAEMGPEGEMPDGTSFPMVLEPWPGGRWYRDLGDNAGHWWGTVQVIKPPTLLEIAGPMFMSFPVSSHMQYRLKEQGDSTHLTITHRAVGLIPEEHRQGVSEGWAFAIQRIRSIAEARRSH